MRLDALLAAVPEVAVTPTGPAPGDVEITSVVHDSRAAGPGALFCCIPGGTTDGHRFAPAAVESGAVALLCERPLDLDVPQLLVDDVRLAMGPVAAAVWGCPSDHLTVVGVTGTNGKTTTVHLLQSMLDACGLSTAVVGTLTGARTTPEATDLQATFAQFREEGRTAVAMEVSSHALVQHRVGGTRFAVAIFTNLSRDHLDYHGTMEEYFKAKARLFEPDLADAAVVNLDDAYGRLLRDAARIPTRGYSLDDAEGLTVDGGGSRFHWRGEEIVVPIGGRFNVSNALAAATAGEILGYAPADIAAGIAAAGSVPGRFEAVDGGQPFRVVVDFAHTPDALERVLESAREVAAGHHVLVVFGCGGERDPSKRPVMGEVAARLADRVVVTSDNPRGEDPATIIDAVTRGIPDPTDVTIEPDRRAAIAAALGAAEAGDVVVIAGKGHEAVQVFADRTVPFDDRTVAREELERLRSSDA